MRYYALKGFYEIEKTIGCGGFAKVKLATHVATGEKVAIKIMEKASLSVDLPRIKLELKALKNFSHQHICKLYQVIETDQHYFIVMEYCSGGELFDHIVEKNKLSEAESRMFFRQIISAVAYIHSLGYAHRDLKPENILLDKEQNLKLIDFGLCAKPQGGMHRPLSTSCGSPTYAAPELILGKQYLGSEVDVWAMGVLLYALMAGFLPFDDNNIDSLYKKILGGKYEEPSFMSNESKNLIRQMLQVDPKKRITVTELLSHSWVTLGVLDPVDFLPESINNLNKECVLILARYHAISSAEIWEHLKQWKYDYDTATYFLLLKRKSCGLPLKLTSSAAKIAIRTSSANSVTNRENESNSVDLSKNALSPAIVGEEMNEGTNMLKLNSSNVKSIKSYKIEKTNGRVASVFTPPTTNLRNDGITRKAQKRIRSPNLDHEYSPVPTKRASKLSTPKTAKSESTSARKVFGNLEKSFIRMRNVLTPKKPAIENVLQPIILTSKDLQNVSTTQYNDPEYVITQLSNALTRKEIHCERKGFRLRGKLEPNSTSQLGGCSFELEICYLPNVTLQENMTPTKSILKDGAFKFSPMSNKHAEFGRNPYVAKVGIRRKRLKGDSWCYKKVCEEVLALTSRDIRQPIESSV
ncbi:hypothetical protein Trydic_g16194 [Trypoxylus dichotomus]